MGNLTVLNKSETDSNKTSQIKSASTLATELNKQILKLYSSFLSEDGSQIDYSSLKESEGFKEYQLKTKELAFVSFLLLLFL